MANFILQLPNNLRLRSFTVSSSSNGATPGVPQSAGPVILELPLDKIRRPLMRTRANDQKKVKELMDSIKEIGLQVPLRQESWPMNVVVAYVAQTLQRCRRVHVGSYESSILEYLTRIDVIEVDGVYYGFSGCHRYEAHQQLGLPTIRCKVRRGTKETLRHHLR